MRILIVLYSLGLGVITDFNNLRTETSAKNIAAFMPVVQKTVLGFNRLDDKAVRVICTSLMNIYSFLYSQFGRYLPAIYPLITDLMARELSPEVRSNLKDYFVRVGQLQGILERT